MRKFAIDTYQRFVPETLKTRIREPAKDIFAILDILIHNFRKDIPSMVEIETNEICTRACHYCPRLQDSGTKMPESTFKSVIDQLSDMGFNGIMTTHQYNEPLTDDRIFGFINYAHNKLPKAKIDF